MCSTKISDRNKAKESINSEFGTNQMSLNQPHSFDGVAMAQLDPSSSSDPTEALLPPGASHPNPNFWSLYSKPLLVGAISGIFFGCLVSFFLLYFQPHLPVPESAEFARPLKLLDKPLVILVSSDGFRWGYQWKVGVPNIDRLRLNGTEAEPGMISVFPTITFPNHYSIATGLYPAWHGIIANSFPDPDPGSNDSFSMGNLDPKWWLGEPIWETVVKNGLHASTYFWPGSEVKKGPWSCPPKFCQHYNKSTPFEERVDTVLGYLDLPSEERPSFISLYFEDPDEQGHKVGADDPQITDAIVRIDAMIGRLLNGIEQRKLLDEITIIMVGDHGMVGTCDKKIFYMEDLAPYINIPDSWVDTWTPLLAIRPPLDIDSKTVYDKIVEGLASGKVENANYLKVYLKEDLPERLHYSASDRIAPIIGLVAEGYKVEWKRSKNKECGGAHGYDNIYASMRSIFIGHGPQFGRGKKVPSFINVEVYNIITAVLKIKGAPNNGTKYFAESILLPQRQ